MVDILIGEAEDRERRPEERGVVLPYRLWPRRVWSGACGGRVTLGVGMDKAMRREPEKGNACRPPALIGLAPAPPDDANGRFRIAQHAISAQSDFEIGGDLRDAGATQ